MAPLAVAERPGAADPRAGGGILLAVQGPELVGHPGVAGSHARAGEQAEAVDHTPAEDRSGAGRPEKEAPLAGTGHPMVTGPRDEARILVVHGGPRAGAAIPMAGQSSARRGRTGVVLILVETPADVRSLGIRSLGVVRGGTEVVGRRGMRASVATVSEVDQTDKTTGGLGRKEVGHAHRSGRAHRAGMDRRGAARAHGVAMTASAVADPSATGHAPRGAVTASGLRTVMGEGQGPLEAGRPVGPRMGRVVTVAQGATTAEEARTGALIRVGGGRVAVMIAVARAAIEPELALDGATRVTVAPGIGAPGIVDLVIRTSPSVGIVVLAGGTLANPAIGDLVIAVMGSPESVASLSREAMDAPGNGPSAGRVVAKDSADRKVGRGVQIADVAIGRVGSALTPTAAGREIRTSERITAEIRAGDRGVVPTLMIARRVSGPPDLSLYRTNPRRRTCPRMSSCHGG